MWKAFSSLHDLAGYKIFKIQWLRSVSSMRVGFFSYVYIGEDSIKTMEGENSLVIYVEESNGITSFGRIFKNRKLLSVSGDGDVFKIVSYLDLESSFWDKNIKSGLVKTEKGIYYTYQGVMHSLWNDIPFNGDIISGLNFEDE